MNNREISDFYRGTFLITFSILVTKILGVFFIIPFSHIIGGENNMSPFTYAYAPYNIMIALTTAGVPLAASKFIAKYNALEAYKTCYKFYKSSFIIMSITGFIGFIVLFLLSPFVAELTLSRENHNSNSWSIDDITWIIRIISLVIIFIPLLASWRGIFQGFSLMGPTALSEITEQLGRIIFILLGSYLSLSMFDKSILFANGIATFGAAIGAIIALITLFFYWRKYQVFFKSLVQKDNSTIDLSLITIYKEIISYSIPFVIVSLIFPLFNLIDQFTHNYTLTKNNVPSELQDMFFNMLNMTTNKIVMIPTSIGVGFSISILPFITKSFENKEYMVTKKYVSKSLTLLLITTVPASLGIMALAQPIYTIFYGYSNDVLGYSPNIEGSKLLFFYAPVAILISLLGLLSSILQGINKQKEIIKIVIISIFIKLIFNVPLIYIFETRGAILSTAIACAFAIVYIFILLKKSIGYRFIQDFVSFGKIGIASLLMMINVEFIVFLFKIYVTVTRGLSIIIVLSSIVVGITTYFVALNILKSKEVSFLVSRLKLYNKM